jgi:transposase-like protein
MLCTNYLLMAKKAPQRGKEKSVIVCPKCKSMDVGLDKANSTQIALEFAARYVCNNCGYNGYFFPNVPVSKLGKIGK